ncbi:MAG: hypothetical protein FWC64_06190 [Treponema sp.]|nr:hypothetical protein [Treponema sp.]
MAGKAGCGAGVTILAAGLLFAFASCASTPDSQAKVDAGVQAGLFEEALTRVDYERGRRGRGRVAVWNHPRNDILFYLDRGMIRHFAGLYEDSFHDLHTAERLIEEAFTRSLTQDISALMLNDTVRDYQGEAYEDLYINVFNALNLYFMGSLEGALVEIRRLNEKLNLLADRYERVARRMLDANQQLDSAGLPIEASRFSNSALARYLGILFYRAAGNPDGVRIEHEELVRAFGLAPDIYTHPIPSSVYDEISIPAGKARLNVIAFTGLSPIKVEEHIWLPLPFPPPNHSVRIALPVMLRRPQAINRVEAVVVETGERFTLELLEDMGAVAKDTFRSTYSLTVIRSAARAITRATAAAIGAQIAEETGGQGMGLAVGILGRVFAEAAERADTRVSRYFPNHALVGAVNLEPGSYTVTVFFYGSAGLVNTQSRPIEVREHTLNLKRFVWLE